MRILNVTREQSFHRTASRLVHVRVDPAPFRLGGGRANCPFFVGILPGGGGGDTDEEDCELHQHKASDRLSPQHTEAPVLRTWQCRMRGINTYWGISAYTADDFVGKFVGALVPFEAPAKRLVK